MLYLVNSLTAKNTLYQYEEPDFTLSYNNMHMYITFILQISHL